MALRPFTEEFNRVLDRRRDDEADLRDLRVLGRNTDGTQRFLPLEGECELRGSVCGFTKGATVKSTCNDFSNRGAAGLALRSRGLSGDTVWIEELDPSTFVQGLDLTVDVIGRGFRASTQINFLEPDSETINPDITILEQTLITPVLIELELRIAADAALIAFTAIAYD